MYNRTTIALLMLKNRSAVPARYTKYSVLFFISAASLSLEALSLTVCSKRRKLAPSANIEKSKFSC